jgi:hypothetical protein
MNLHITPRRHMLVTAPASRQTETDWLECKLCGVGGEDSGGSPCIQRPRGLRLLNAIRAFKHIWNVKAVALDRVAALDYEIDCGEFVEIAHDTAWDVAYEETLRYVALRFGITFGVFTQAVDQYIHESQENHR